MAAECDSTSRDASNDSPNEQLTALEQRRFADIRRPDQVVLPGTASGTAPRTPTPPLLPTDPIAPPPSSAVPTPPAPPPTPEEVGSKLPPTDTVRPKPAPVSSLPPPPPPPPKTSRFTTFLVRLFLLSTLGYAGGVYYSLVSDNFHDFFTEYVPFGEDAVAYFEEREFRKRFPSRPLEPKNYPQIRGENKVTVSKSSGVSPREAEPADLGRSGRHTSALSDNAKPAAAPQADESKKLAPKADAKPTSAQQAKSEPKPQVPQVEAKSASPAPVAPKAATTPLVDHVSVQNSTEPVVQAAVKMLNDLITAINADPDSAKYQTSLIQAKSQLRDVVTNIADLKQQLSIEAEKKVTDAHREFDTAARELVSRLEKEMQEQELKWREEYESEREKISKSYQERLNAEVESVRKLAQQQNENALIEQQIALNRRFGRQVQDRVEQERAGRLGKLEALSSSVSELEKLTADWNSVISSNLSTQHLHVALESVRAAVARFEHPTPFVSELAALKEVAAGNELVNAAVASIPPAAYQRGLPSTAHLVDRFRRVAAEVRKAALLPADAGVASHAASAVLSKFMFSRKAEGFPESGDVEAVLARAEILLEEGALDDAAREMNALHGWAGVLSKDWVAECRRVLETKQALEVIATEARLQSLLVD